MRVGHNLNLNSPLVPETSIIGFAERGNLAFRQTKRHSRVS